MIEFVNVSKVYGETVALLDVSCYIDAGEFVFLVGPSGAGKSTFTRLIYREEVPTRGMVVVDGVNVGRLRRREVPFLRRRMGIVFQDYKLLPDKTVYENVAFAMLVTGATPRRIGQRVPQVLDLVGLGDRHRAYPHQLSGGEQQRAAVARAIANEPRLLLADEPTGNLDPDTAWGIMELLSEINRIGTTVVVATHAQHIVDAMGRRVIALRGGQIVRDQLQGVYHAR
ncbi:MAG TPA: cell division ATP-binding protein FtsE [Bacillota bacterium]